MNAPTLEGPWPNGWPGWGVDCSEYAPLDRAALVELRSHGASFLVARATEGVDPDPSFTAHVRYGTELGYAVGAYTFVLPPAASGIAWPKQTTALETVTRPHADVLRLLALDVENGRGRPVWTTADQPARTVRAMLWRLYTATRRRPWIYTYRSFFKQWLTTIPDVYPLWLSAFDRHATFPKLEGQVGRPVQLWQFGGGPLGGRPGARTVRKDVAPRPDPF